MNAAMEITKSIIDEMFTFRSFSGKFSITHAD